MSKNKEMASEEARRCSSVVVAMVPLPAQSHLNSHLLLAHAIASCGVQVHYVGMALHNSQVKSRSTIPNPNIIFHDLPTPEFASPPPNKTMSHTIPLLQATLGLRKPVTTLLESLAVAARRLIVVHDPLMSYVVLDACALPNAESYLFNCISAVATIGIARDTAGEETGEGIPSSRGCLDAECQDLLDQQFVCLERIKTSGHLRNTCRVIESEFLDILEENEGVGVNQWAVGPLETVTAFKDKSTNSSDRSERVSRCLEWLNEQEPKSVLYVCFGTTTSMEDEEIRELAIGLEKSGTKFIWALREAEKANISDELEERKTRLPLGFDERVEGLGKGMVMREWVPQLEILAHPSTGGFMSHCGWNSCLESLSLGVPLLAWPMFGDQPMNASLVVNKLKAGFDVREWAKREELVRSSVIAEAVDRLMNSEEGSDIKKRAGDLGYELRKSAQKDGVSRMELEGFVAHITRV